MWFKKKNSPSKIADRIERGELSVPDGQALLSLRHLEAQVVDAEHSTRDHSNLVDLRNTWGKVILGILIATIVSDFILIVMGRASILRHIELTFSFVRFCDTIRAVKSPNV